MCEIKWLLRSNIQLDTLMTAAFLTQILQQDVISLCVFLYLFQSIEEYSVAMELIFAKTDLFAKLCTDIFDIYNPVLNPPKNVHIMRQRCRDCMSSNQCSQNRGLKRAFCNLPFGASFYTTCTHAYSCTPRMRMLNNLHFTLPVLCRKQVTQIL